MFNWFRPKCPVDADVQAWVHERMDWLAGQFGWEILAESEVVLPIDEHFPAAYDGSEEAVRHLFAQVCEYMQIDAKAVELKFYSEGRDPFRSAGVVVQESGGTAGLYEPRPGRTAIWLETSNLIDPTRVVATIAHELCHAHLLGGNRLSRDAADHEAVTDLAAIFFGMGVFTANASLRERTMRVQDRTWWSISRLGYLTDQVLAYALALYAWTRDERTDWQSYLRADIRALFRASLSYLEAVKEDAIARPQTGESIKAGPYPDEVIAKLYWKAEPKDATPFDEADAGPDVAHSTADEIYTQAVFLMERGEWKEAVELFSQIVRDDPTDGDAYQQRAAALLELGFARDALDDAEKAIEYAPDDAESFEVRGRAYLECQQFDRAAADFTRYLDEEDYRGANPMRIGSVYYHRGVAFSRVNDFAAAAADFTRALRNRPQWADAYEARAGAYDRLGEFSKAQADRDEACRLREDAGT